MNLSDPQDIRQAIRQNNGTPYGTARSARAEELSAAAERSGDAAVLRQALFALVDAYTWSSERTKALVPFSRLLQEYDRDPGAFEGWQTHSLFWSFKWVTGDIIDLPEVAIADVESWFQEMERRYRLAGHSERAVRQSEFYLAESTGDLERADRAVAGWMAARRDRMSNCHACELGTQGRYWASRGQDEKAMDIWRPVTSGSSACREEPHRVLGYSLLPLLRLGRFAEARTHHLKGYRLARGNDSLLRTIGQHIEFCALTGNEPRGLEILTEHAAHLGPLADSDAQLSLNGGILVLLRRLKELGHSDLTAIRHGGAERTVGELYDLLYQQARAIAERFDLRNGNTYISDRFEERVARQPLTDALPLGIRSERLSGVVRSGGAGGTVGVAGVAGAGAVGGAGAVAGAGGVSAVAGAVGSAAAAEQVAGRSSAAPSGLPELIEGARTLRDRRHPGARLAWERVAEAVGAREPTDPALPAELLEHRAVTAAEDGAGDAGALLRACSAAYRAAGQAARAALAELHLAVHAASAGEAPESVREQLAVAAQAAESLDPADPWRSRRIASAALVRIRIEAQLRERAAAERAAAGRDDGDDADGRAGRADPVYVSELRAFVAETGDGTDGTDGADRADLADLANLTVLTNLTDLTDLAAEAETTLARLALVDEDITAAELLLASAAARFRAPGRPWDAAEPLGRRAELLLSLDRTEEAEASARAALDAGAELTDPEQQGTVRLVLADVLMRRDQSAEAAEHALEAAHWFDQGGLEADGGAHARRLLAQAYRAQDRVTEAAEVLQSALPDLVRQGPRAEAQARSLLAELLRELNDQRAAAEQFLRAAEVAKDWDDPLPQARFAHGAADCLARAGLEDAADAAYGRALELWREGGDRAGEVRVLRSLAWRRFWADGMDDLEYASAESLALARPLMDRALAVLDGAQDPDLRYERAQTLDQYAELLADFLDEYEDEDEDGGDEYEDKDGDEDGGDEREQSPDLSLLGEAVDLFSRAAQEYGALGDAHTAARSKALDRAGSLQKPAASAVEAGPSGG
ncbi:hypothetical protein [Streptomyces sp. N35]|uniref:hypothetical protein n=1 Tax=Streptomyces sp. N35 TaxID=2795730 RepID=UPI0018F51580|nr:hypothetical protein [Streptomyces sp. N35]